MSVKKIKLIYAAVFLVAVTVILLLINKTSGIITQNPSNVKQLFFEWQKLISLWNIIFFAVLTFTGMYIYYKSGKKSLLILPLLIYITTALYSGVTLSRNFYITLQLQANTQNSYWLTSLMTAFFILGAILVSAIAFVTIKNLNKRNKNIEKLNNPGIL